MTFAPLGGAWAQDRATSVTTTTGSAPADEVVRQPRRSRVVAQPQVRGRLQTRLDSRVQTRIDNRVRRASDLRVSAGAAIRAADERTRSAVSPRPR